MNHKTAISYAWMLSTNNHNNWVVTVLRNLVTDLNNWNVKLSQRLSYITKLSHLKHYNILFVIHTYLSYLQATLIHLSSFINRCKDKAPYKHTEPHLTKT